MHESEMDVIVEWRIDRFFSASGKDGAYYHSHGFSFSGEEWCLEIYPNGYRKCNLTAQVDLSLYKCSLSPYIKQIFSFSLKSVKGKNIMTNIVKETLMMKTTIIILIVSYRHQNFEQDSQTVS